MRILHVIDRFNPLLGQEINFIARNRADDLEMTILTSTSLKPWQINDYRSVENEDNIYRENYHVSIVRQKILFEAGEKLWIRNIIKEIRRLQPEVLYVHGIEYITFFRIILWHHFTGRHAFRLFTDTHSLPAFSRGNLFRKFYYYFLSNVIIPLVNKYNITSFHTAEENLYLLEKIYGVNPEFIKPFLIGADLNAFKFSPGERQNIRKGYNIGTNEILLIYTGRMCIQKSPHLILEALEKIKTELNIKTTGLFIGFQDMEYMNKIFLPLTSSETKVIIEPALPSDMLFGYYSAADFAVFPLESTLSSLECQACKLPVIMQSNVTNEQRLRKGGLLYEKGNISDLADKILLLINDFALRKRLAEDGSLYVSQNYDYEKNLRQMENYLRSDQK
jgi:glycosyltransferase involved in cell wall biosynthesis